MIRKLYDFISSCYSQEEYPALLQQARQWQISRPLQGLRILDATPVFCNTSVKYYALLSAGAELTVSVGKDIPYDPEIFRRLPDFGIKILTDRDRHTATFDLIADCAGRHRDIPSRFGYVELTRSGLEYYRDCPLPVISADTGIVKTFETVLGTGDGFIRAMQKSGYDEFRGKNFLIFGGGKVGLGIKLHLDRLGASTWVVDKKYPDDKYTNNGYFSLHDPAKIRDLIAQAWCIISVTGIAGALKDFVPELATTSALIANMGVEDEFSSALPPERVLNGKRPLNFILDEPTRLEYIDPVMALSNYSLRQLINGRLPLQQGIMLPFPEDENRVLSDVSEKFKDYQDVLRKIFNGEII